MSKKLFAAALIAAASTSASAGVLASNTTAITSTAQGYSQAFNLGNQAQSGVVLSITAKGDFGTNYAGFDEYLDFFIDGVKLAHWSSTNGGPTTVITNYADYDYTLSGSIALSAAQWAQFSADKVLNVHWQNTSMVNPYADLGGADFVSFTIESRNAATAVPEPTSLALLGLGLAGFALARRRKS
ncbi:PEP-CTERM sorting domain-containing protein [Pseudoduganella violaceinigra]|uniref:PEP-CTERM sorting domain-containing protein n=1 Tax=Pseudoduganella violaceinigra TaxID=246602 RepID=UPI0004073401|nr:PEP-CTERM sorting domain-containing protein [Pseudoduganella violaceinigra]